VGRVEDDRRDEAAGRVLQPGAIHTAAEVRDAVEHRHVEQTIEVHVNDQDRFRPASAARCGLGRLLLDRISPSRHFDLTDSTRSFFSAEARRDHDPVQ
jgi:hypothetical protein